MWSKVCEFYCEISQSGLESAQFGKLVVCKQWQFWCHRTEFLIRIEIRRRIWSYMLLNFEPGLMYNTMKSFTDTNMQLTCSKRGNRYIVKSRKAWSLVRPIKWRNIPSFVCLFKSATMAATRTPVIVFIHKVNLYFYCFYLLRRGKRPIWNDIGSYRVKLTRESDFARIPAQHYSGARSVCRRAQFISWSCVLTQKTQACLNSTVQQH